MPYNIKNHEFNLQNKMNAGIKAVTIEQLNNGEEEVYVDFRTKATGQVVLKVRNLLQKNETIKNRVKKEDAQHKSVLHIFIDTLSRNQFHRRYNRTSKFLNEYHHSRKKNKRVYEFFRLHSIKGYTLPNLIASVYGVNDFFIDKNEDLKRVEHYAQDAGYITGIASDLCDPPEYFLRRNQLFFLKA